MEYRKEIDGLRSVAVLPVILFHAGFSIFSGGYVGVDVFFVISGYLITGILLRDLELGRFSILKFYERRARRILPALFAVMLVCVPFAWLWMIPLHFEQFARSLVAVSLFISNVLFWYESGYFGGSAEFKPLLHTWSLAVEEQYYVLFPIFLALLWRLRGHWALLATVLVSVLSFGLCLWAVRFYPDANFYLLPTRGWELLVGSLGAFWQRGGRRGIDPRLSPWLAAAGFAMILYAVFAFDEHTPFPSAYALLPVMGTLLVLLFSSAQVGVGWLLARPAPVFIGLISYSAYLWHQPLFAFARIRLIDEPPALLMGALALASLGLAYLSWRYVEAPFRAPGYAAAARRGLALSQRAILGGALAGLIAWIALGAALTQRPQSFPAQVETALKGINNWADRSVCIVNTRPRAGQLEKCLDKTREAGLRPALLIGDSHAGALSKALRAALQDRGYGLISFTHPACYPVKGVRRLPLPSSQSCQDFTQTAYGMAERLPEAPVLVFSRWMLNLDGARFDNGAGGLEKGPSGAVYATGLGPQGFGAAEDLRREQVVAYTVAQLTPLARSGRLILIEGLPEAGWQVPLRLQKMVKFGDAPVGEISISAAVVQARMQSAAPIFAMLEAAGAQVFAPAGLVCSFAPEGRCVQFDGRDLLYRDDDHPSLELARRMARRLAMMLP